MLLGFDPIKYLDLHIDSADRHAVSDGILDVIAQYIATRTIELLPENQLSEISDIAQVFEHAQKTIPNYDQKIKEFLNDFKKEYKNQVGAK